MRRSKRDSSRLRLSFRKNSTGGRRSGHKPSLQTEISSPTVRLRKVSLDFITAPDVSGAGKRSGGIKSFKLQPSNALLPSEASMDIALSARSGHPQEIPRAVDDQSDWGVKLTLTNLMQISANLELILHSQIANNLTDGQRHHVDDALKHLKYATGALSKPPDRPGSIKMKSVRWKQAIGASKGACAFITLNNTLLTDKEKALGEKELILGRGEKPRSRANSPANNPIDVNQKMGSSDSEGQTPSSAAGRASATTSLEVSTISLPERKSASEVTQGQIQGPPDPSGKRTTKKTRSRRNSYIVPFVLKEKLPQEGPAYDVRICLMNTLKKWGIQSLSWAWLRWRRSTVAQFELNAWRRMYEIMDSNGDGSMDQDELVTFIKEVGLNQDTKNIQELMHKYDTDGDGTLDIEEFMDMMTGIYLNGLKVSSAMALADGNMEEKERSQWKNAFHLFDERETGFIQMHNLKALFEKVGHRFSNKQLKFLKKKADLIEKVNLAQSKTSSLLMWRSKDPVFSKGQKVRVTLHDEDVRGSIGFVLHPAFLGGVQIETEGGTGAKIRKIVPPEKLIAYRAFEVGDKVKVIKNKSQFFGRYARVVQPDWTGRVKVEMEEDGAVKSYLDEELELVSTGKTGIFAASNAPHGITFRQFMSMMTLVRDEPLLLQEIQKMKESWLEKYLAGHFMISPFSLNLFYWNLLTTAWVMYYAFYIPVKIAFKSRPSPFSASLVYLADVWFIVDVIVNLHVATIDDAGDEIKSLKATRLHYMETWLFLDLASSVPSNIIALVYPAASNLLFLRVLRLCKIWHLLRLLNLKAKGADSRPEKIQPAVVRLLKILFSACLILHFIACAYWFVVDQSCELTEDDIDSEFSSDLFCPEPWRVGVLTEFGGPRASLYEKYLPAMYWAICAMLGNNLSPRTNLQFWISGAMLILGIGIFAVFVGSFTSVLQNMDAMSNARGEQLNSINAYLVFRKVDKGLRLKIQGYYDYLWMSGQSRHQKNLFEELPAQLKLELSVTLKEQMLLGVSLFRDLHPATLVAIIKELIPHLILPGYVLIRQGETGEHMYLLYRGKLGVYVSSEDDATVETQVAVLRNGACFGELALYGDRLRKATVRSLEYCEVESLSFSAVKGLEVFFPDLKTKITSFARNRFANNYRNRKQQELKATLEREEEKMNRQKDGKGKLKERETFRIDSEKGQTLTRDQKHRIKRQYTSSTAAMVANIYEAAREDANSLSVHSNIRCDNLSFSQRHRMSQEVFPDEDE